MNNRSAPMTYNAVDSSFGSTRAERILTGDELALHERYSNPLQNRSINLQVTDRTDPVDIHIHRDTNHLYVCDIGRSLVEIFDVTGTLLHSINDSIINNFHPTAILVKSDGTIIVSSFFSHYLQMYSPMTTQFGNDMNMAVNRYSYQTFKLGIEGHQIHQFYHPSGMTIDHQSGYIYVCDRENRRIKVLTPQGICERIIHLVSAHDKRVLLSPIHIAYQSMFDRLVCIVNTGDTICLFSKHANGFAEFR
jgi:6-phosphogluconolactonase (cycloisomerase 2 family)